MPFDGSELLGTTLDAVPLPKPATGVWARMRRVGRALLPSNRPAPFGIPLPTPARPELLTLQVLQLGRTLLEDERNWIQRRYETLDGRRCAVGALRSAARLLELRGQPNGPHNMLLTIAISRGYTDVEKMNDHSSHAQGTERVRRGDRPSPFPAVTSAVTRSAAREIPGAKHGRSGLCFA